jgi:hypothetical protein
MPILLHFSSLKQKQKQWKGLPPDFLSNFLALANCMRLSLKKAAQADAGWSRVQEIRVAPSFSAHVPLGERGAPVQ